MGFGVGIGVGFGVGVGYIGILSSCIFGIGWNCGGGGGGGVVIGLGVVNLVLIMCILGIGCGWGDGGGGWYCGIIVFKCCILLILGGVGGEGLVICIGM